MAHTEREHYELFSQRSRATKLVARLDSTPCHRSFTGKHVALIDGRCVPTRPTALSNFSVPLRSYARYYYYYYYLAACELECTSIATRAESLFLFIPDTIGRSLNRRELRPRVRLAR